MPVTELALFRLNPGQAASSPALQSFLLEAADVMSSHVVSTGPFRYFLSTDDPTHIYLVGEWASARAHWEEFIPSEANGKLLERAGRALGVEWMFHMDVAQGRLPLEKDSLRIERWVVKVGEKEAFGGACEELESKSKDGTDIEWAGGWRIEVREDSRAEWVMLVAQREGKAAATEGEEKNFFSKLLRYVQHRSVERVSPLKLENPPASTDKD